MRDTVDIECVSCGENVAAEPDFGAHRSSAETGHSILSLRRTRRHRLRKGFSDETSTCPVALLLAAILAGALLGLHLRRRRRPPGNTEPIVATEKDDGQTLDLAKGQDLMIKLPANPSTGYTWVVLSMPSVVESVGEPAFASKAPEGSAIAGAGGTMTLTFRAVDAGAGKLDLGYMRPWETDVAPEKSYSLNLSVK